MDLFIITPLGTGIEMAISDPRITPGPACTGSTVYFSRDDAEVALMKLPTVEEIAQYEVVEIVVTPTGRTWRF